MGWPFGENTKAKALLDRIVAMLTKLGQRGNDVRGEPVEFSTRVIDSDSDSDPDPERSSNTQKPSAKSCT